MGIWGTMIRNLKPAGRALECGEPHTQREQPLAASPPHGEFLASSKTHTNIYEPGVNGNEYVYEGPSALARSPRISLRQL